MLFLGLREDRSSLTHNLRSTVVGFAVYVPLSSLIHFMQSVNANRVCSSAATNDHFNYQ